MFFSRGSAPFVFLGILILEIYLFALIGGWLGAGLTVLLVIAFTAFGVSMMKQQGMMNITNVQDQLKQGQPPSFAIIYSMLRSLAGLLLILPGFFTGALGLLLLLPPIRGFFVGRILKRVQSKFSEFSEQMRKAAEQAGYAEHAQHGQNQGKATQPDQISDSERQPKTFEGEIEHRDD